MRVPVTSEFLQFLRTHAERTGTPVKTLVRTEPSKPAGLSQAITDGWFSKENPVTTAKPAYIQWFRDIYPSLPPASELSGLQRKRRRTRRRIEKPAAITSRDILFIEKRISITRVPIFVLLEMGVNPPEGLDYGTIRGILKGPSNVEAKYLRWIKETYRHFPKAIVFPEYHKQKLAQAKRENQIDGTSFLADDIEAPAGLTVTRIGLILGDLDQPYPPSWVQFICARFDAIQAGKQQEPMLERWSDDECTEAKTHIARADVRLSRLFRDRAAQVPDGFDWALADRLIKGAVIPHPPLYRDWLLATLQALPSKGEPIQTQDDVFDHTLSDEEKLKLQALLARQGPPYMFLRGQGLTQDVIAHADDLFYGRADQTSDKLLRLLFDLYKAGAGAAALGEEAFTLTDEDRAYLRVSRERTGIPEHELINQVGSVPAGLDSNTLQWWFTPDSPPTKKSFFSWAVGAYGAQTKEMPRYEVTHGRTVLTETVRENIKTDLAYLRVNQISVRRIFKAAGRNVPLGLDAKKVSDWLNPRYTNPTADTHHLNWFLAQVDAIRRGPKIAS